MQIRPLQPILFSLLILTAAGLSGCDTLDQSTSSVIPFTVKMNLGEIPASPMAKASGTNMVTSGHIITFSKLKILVEELELESAGEDSMDIEIENREVDVPLDGSVVNLASQDIPDGLYEEFELEIDKSDGDEGEPPVNDPDFSDGDHRYSLVVKGQYNGQEFMFRSEKEYEVELEFDTPLEIDGQVDAASINVTLDLASWFIDPDSGADLDPTDPGNTHQIEKNIAHSFDVKTELEEKEGDHEGEGDDQEEKDDDEEDGENQQEDS